ncbi:helix-turn-helix transcriptional regulator [Haloparvum sp. PAK95]|uniref:helix-turn-helix transcriptional regulator n=1 Tax=Haloparvum sp. PAK95 TaxID=3418962 RepID=UPI003D2F2AFC
MSRAALLVTTLVLVAAVGAGVAGTGAATAGSGSMGSDATPSGSLSADGPPAALQQSFDRSVVRIRVDADGSARWTFRYKRTLETDQEREDFAAYAEEFNENETALYDSFRSDATALVAEGSNQTGRNMTATSFARNAAIESSLGNDVGVVELSFTWESFAEVDGDTVVVGDVFEGGLYVGPDQELVVDAGDGLVFESVAPNGTQSNPESLRESDTVTWTGEQQFTDQRPRIVLVPESAATATESGAASTPATTPSETSTATGAGDGDGGANWLPLLAVALVTLVGAGWYRERSGTAGSPLAAIDPRSTDGGSAVGAGDDESGGTAARRDDPGTEGTAGAGTGAGDGTGAGAVTDADTDAAGTAAAGSAAAGGASDDESGSGEAAEGTAKEPAVPDEAFLSDEDRVRKLLRENGGRMKQVRIVEETGWSKSKVSVLLSEMEDEGVVSKLRVGRENVVSLDGHEPEAAKSPFDDEDA